MSSSSFVPLSPKCAFDDHEIEITVLQSRLQTDTNTGLSSELASKRHVEIGPNILPTDMESGHGAIHELVAVLRDGGWIHTRAENLVSGDVVALKQGHSVPADCRIFQSDDLWVDSSCLNGKMKPEQRTASNLSVFEEHSFHVPYMESTNVVFYGTKIVRGSARALVLRTGAQTVLGVISQLISNLPSHDNTYLTDEKLLDELKGLGICINGSGIPTIMKSISTVVCEHASATTRTVMTVTFGSSLPAVVKSELGMEASESEIEQDIATQMMEKYQQNEAANAFMRAMAACCNLHNTTTSSNYFDFNETESDLDGVDRQKHAISRFCGYFGQNSPTAQSHRKKRFRSFLCGTLSGCEVYVHFDDACGAHVVVLEGPVREILSRCGKVYRLGKIDTLETADLREVNLVISELEKLDQDVIGFAEIYLDPHDYPVNYHFDIEQLNFPTEKLCYLGALGIVDRLHPEVTKLIRQAEASDLRLIITTDTPWQGKSIDDVVMQYNNKFSRTLNLKLKELETDKPFHADCDVISNEAISIGNTLSEWKDILLKGQWIILCQCTPAQVDLVVETLQDLEENVAFISSGNAHALTMKKAHIGFALPTNSTIDLCEEAATVVLGFSDSPRCDAIRMIRTVKQKLASGIASNVENGYTKIGSTTQHDSEKEKQIIQKLFEDVIIAAQLMHLTNEEIQDCVNASLHKVLEKDNMPSSMGQLITSMAGAFFQQR